MVGLRRGVIGVAVAGLSLLRLLGAVSAEGAPVNAAASPPAAFSCGSFDRWGSAPAGTHFSATARLGSSAATLEGAIGDDAFTRVIPAPMLVIRDGDTTVRSGPVGEPVGLAGPPGVTMTVPSTPATAITPDNIVQSLAGRGLPEVVTPLCVARFADEGHPVVLLGLFTGGAHCCTILRAYPRSGSESSTGLDVIIGNPGVDVRSDPHGRGAIVVTADDAFNYQFAPYAFSGVPIEVLTFRKGGFTDITWQYPDLVRRDAAQWWKSFSADPSNGLGTLAAWMADQCLLGKGRNGWATIDRLLAEGKLSGDPNAGTLWSTGGDYVTALHAFLFQHGYCR